VFERAAGEIARGNWVGIAEALTAIIYRLHDEDDGVRAAAARSLGSFVYQSRAYPVPPSGSDPLRRRIDHPYDLR
jgi:hypothetical protein